MIAFDVEGGGRVVLSDPALVVVGYSGRDITAVHAHVAELAAHGVPAPREVPAVWRLPSSLLSQEGKVQTRPGATSGEVEPVLVITEGAVYVTVGSDHTDREMERTSMEDAKQACAKVVGDHCWPLDAVLDRWDTLRLESEVERDGGWRPYQGASVDALLPPAWYLERFKDEREAVVFCGTVPAGNGIDTSAAAFRGRLVDPETGAALACEYQLVTS